MPLGGGAAHIALSQYVPSRESRERIETALGPLLPIPGGDSADEARNYRFQGSPNGEVIGFISPVSEPYCGSCNRMRLTADGKFHLYLLNADGLEAQAAVPSGGAPGAVEAFLAKAV